MPTSVQASGQYGAAWNAGISIGTLTNWNVSATADTKSFTASNTQGGTGRRTGNLDWSGSVKQLLAWPLDESMMPAGSMWDFVGYFAPTTGVVGTAGPGVGGPVFTESVVLAIDWTASSIIEWTTNFSGNGELLWLDAGDTSFPVPPVDNTFPVAISSKDTSLEIAVYNPVTSSIVWTPFCTDKCTITFKANLYPFSDSCTGGFVHKVTGTKDWTAVVTMNDPNMNHLVSTGVDLRQNEFVGLRVVFAAYLGGIPPIELLWGLTKDFSNINVDIATGAMISYDVQIDMSADGGPNTGITNSSCRFPSGPVGLGTPFQWWP